MFLNNLKSAKKLVQVFLLLAILGLLVALLVPGGRPALNWGNIFAVKEIAGPTPAPKLQVIDPEKEGFFNDAAPDFIAALFGWRGSKPIVASYKGAGNNQTASLQPLVSNFISYIGRYYTAASQQQIFIFKELATYKIYDLKVGERRGDFQLVEVTSDGFLVKFKDKPYLVKVQSGLSLEQKMATQEKAILHTPSPSTNNKQPVNKDERITWNSTNRSTDSGANYADSDYKGNWNGNTNYPVPTPYVETETTSNGESKSSASTGPSTEPTPAPEKEEEATAKPVRSVHRDDPIKNGNFEEANGANPLPDNWQMYAQKTAENHTYWHLERGRAYEGSRYAVLENVQPNDAGFMQRVRVTNNRVYRIVGYIKVLESIAGEGASLSLLNVDLDYPTVAKKNNRWEKVEIVGRTAYWRHDIKSVLDIVLRLGNRDQLSTGSVAFDCIYMEPINFPDDSLEIVEFYSPTSDENELLNGSFEWQAGSGGPRDWEVEKMSGDTQVVLQKNQPYGSNWQETKLQINHGNTASYTRVFQRVSLRPDTTYGLHYSINFSENLGSEVNNGTTILLNGASLLSYDVKKTDGSTIKISYLNSDYGTMSSESYFKTGPAADGQERIDVDVELILGKDSSNPIKGKVIFDDLYLYKSSGAPKIIVTEE
jgi:hypothetical protein